MTPAFGKAPRPESAHVQFNRGSRLYTAGVLGDKLIITRGWNANGSLGHHCVRRLSTEDAWDEARLHPRGLVARALGAIDIAEREANPTQRTKTP